ncbi:hypothetical protein H0H87_005232 [Tephrocybe sp. NHM501043]|nr:hypothetical protein H0H87_005232 [Tephrocybe sp. NHM501043]
MNEMPAFRNLKTRRSSGRIWNMAPIAYDGSSLFTSLTIVFRRINNAAENGWQIPNNTEPAVPSHTYMASPHSSATSPSVASVDSDFEAPARKNKGKSKVIHSSDPDYIPRPKNAFIFFRSYFYQTLGGSDQNQISVAAGKAWKALSQTEKAPFQLMADREKREHQDKFPNYTYAPGLKSENSKRKKSAAKKKKTQLSTKTSLIPQPAQVNPRRLSRMKVEPPSPKTLTSLIPILSLPSPNVTEHTGTTPNFTNDDTLRSHPGLTANWSFPTAFVPTSEIPPLELSPAKSEQEDGKDTGSLASSLRPPNFDISNEPFCHEAAPVTISTFFNPPPLPDLNYDYTGYGMQRLIDPTQPFYIDPSSSQFNAWYNDDHTLSGPLEFSYAGYTIPSNAAGVYTAMDVFEMQEENAQMGDYQSDIFELPTPVPTNFTAHTSILAPAGHCEMDEYVDYGGCDA